MGLKDYQGSSRGIRINYKKEITWVQAAKRLKEIQEKERKAMEAEIAAKSAPNELPEDRAPVIIDADFREVEEPSKPMTDKEKMAILKQKEQDFVVAFYKSLYTGQKEIIKTRKAADITKMFKKEYGEIYDGGNDGQSKERLLWNCYPDKICFSISGMGASLQIIWGKFTTKLLQVLDEQPELEAGVPEEPDDEREEIEELQEIEKEPEPDPEYYNARDVEELLQKHEADLKAYREVGGLPEMLLKKQRILVDALTLFLREIEKQEAEIYED